MLRWARKAQLSSGSAGLGFSFTSDLLWDVDLWVLVPPSGNGRWILVSLLELWGKMRKPPTRGGTLFGAQFAVRRWTGCSHPSAGLSPACGTTGPCSGSI